MKITEAIRYLTYANPDAEVEILSKDTYDRLLRKARILDEIIKRGRDAYYKNAKKGVKKNETL